MPNAQDDLIGRARMFQERAEQALDPISRQHYLEMAVHYRALAVEHQEMKAAPEREFEHGASGVRAAGPSYLILAKHSFRRSSSERT